MSYGKMRTFIDIEREELIYDADGFSQPAHISVARVRAYKESRHGNEKWAKLAAFSTASVMFVFRKIPGVTVDTSMYINDGEARYNIVSVEDVRHKGVYVEVLAEAVMPSKGGG